MKINFLLVSLLFFVFNAHFCFAQMSYQAKNPQRGNRNVLKINLLALPFKNINLEYERFWSRRVSGALQFSLVHNYKALGLFSGNDILKDTPFVLQFTPIGGYSAVGQLRFYLGKSKLPPVGFYFSPYIKRLKYESSIIYRDNMNEYKGLARFSSTNFGLNLGYQWQIKQRITIDWQFLGISYNISRGGFQVNNLLDGNQFTRQVKDVLEKYALLGFVSRQLGVGSLVNGNYVFNTPPLGYPSMRVALSVGIAF